MKHFLFAFDSQTFSFHYIQIQLLSIYGKNWNLRKKKKKKIVLLIYKYEISTKLICKTNDTFFFVLHCKLFFLYILGI